MLDTIQSAGSTSSQASTFSRPHVTRSLADELEGHFEDVALSPIMTFEITESPISSLENITGATKKVEDMGLEDRRATQGQSKSAAIANDTSDSTHSLKDSNERPPTAEATSKVLSSQAPKKTKSVERLNPVSFTPQSVPFSEHKNISPLKLEFIDRNTDGYFKMETTPSVTDVERRIQQSKGIAALQKTLIPSNLPDTASSMNGGPYMSSSRGADRTKRPSNLRKITFTEPRDRKPKETRGPYGSATTRSKAAPRFSLGRELVAASKKNRVVEPLAPIKFVRLPTDPAVNCRRSFASLGLKISIPEPESSDDGSEGSASSITSVPSVDSTGAIGFKDRPRFEFGTPRAFIADQCFESSCPIRFAHAKGPYHHRGQRNHKLMAGLFGHSNPPPEIWNAYRNMVESFTSLSPDRSTRSKWDEDLVIAFAMFHYGDLNSMSGEEFHRLYAGKHTSSMVTLQTENALRSESSCSLAVPLGSCLGHRK